MSKLRESESALRREVDELRTKYQQELAEWEEAFREADAARGELIRRLSTAETAATDREQAMEGRLEELARERRAAEDRLDQMIDRLRPLVAERRLTELTRVIDAFWVAIRFSRSNLPLHKQAVELGSVIEHAASATSDTLKARGQHLTVSLPLETEWLWGDPPRLEQLLAEFLQSASERAKPEARMELVAERRADDVRLCLVDQVAEVSAEDIARLSELRLGTNGHSALYTDADLSVALCRTLAELHGGELTVLATATGNGMETVCRLPVLPKEEPIQATPQCVSDDHEQEVSAAMEEVP
jgi:signal transduction histidine kinase